MTINPKKPNKYVGPDQYYIPSVNQPTAKETDPTSGDYINPLTGMIYNLGTIWLNAATNTPWMFGSAKTWFKLASAAGADVAGPASATDNALARFDGTTGKLIKNSVGILSNAGVFTGITQMGIGIAPTARLTLAAGTATAGTAPLKLTAGIDLTAPEDGAIEYDGTHLTYTDNVPTRRTLAVGPASSTNNRLTRMDGTAGAIKEATGTTLSDTDVMTFPAGGGNVLTSGGADARKGSATLVGGTVTVATTSAVTDSAICLTITALGTVTDPMPLFVTINTGVGFDITSSDATDTSTITWAIVG